MHNENGNVFIYILIGIVLLAALNAIVSRSGEEDGSSERLSEAKRSLLTDEIMLHAASAKQAVKNMQSTGTNMALNPSSSRPDDFYVTRRSDPNYGSEPPANIHNFLHPTGGGFQHKGEDDYRDSLFTGPTDGWMYQTDTNVDWSEESGVNEIIIALPKINKQVCEEINKRITGSKTIPQETANSYQDLFDEEAGTPTDLTAGNCSGCEGHPNLCIEVTSSGDYVYYNILISN